MARTRSSLARGSKGLLFDIAATPAGNPEGRPEPFGELTIEGLSSYFEWPASPETAATVLSKEIVEMWRRKITGGKPVRRVTSRGIEDLPAIDVRRSKASTQFLRPSEMRPASGVMEGQMVSQDFGFVSKEWLQQVQRELKNVPAWEVELVEVNTNAYRTFFIYPHMTYLQVGERTLTARRPSRETVSVFPGLVERTGLVLRGSHYGTFSSSFLLAPSSPFVPMRISLINDPVLLVQIDKALEKGLA